MAEINLSALIKFNAMWKPLLDVLPEIIHLVEQRADLERTVAVYKQQAELANEGLSAVNKAAAEAKERFDNDVALYKEQRDTWVAELNQFRADAEKERAAVESAFRAARSSHDTAMAAANKELAELQQHLADRKAQAENEFNTRKEELDADIARLEAVRTKAQKALDSLRAKLD